MGALLGYDKETIIEGIEGQEGKKVGHVGGYAIRGLGKEEKKRNDTP